MGEKNGDAGIKVFLNSRSTAISYKEESMIEFYI